MKRHEPSSLKNYKYNQDNITSLWSNKLIYLPPINTLLPPPPPPPPSPPPPKTTYHHGKSIDLWYQNHRGVHQICNGDIVAPSLEKCKRKRILPYQYQCLVQCFEKTNSPNSEVREKLAIELNMTKREVQVWFQNRR
ncbi:hypothetical protein K501DRAFT_222514, partial [Backusella circina FSU 941]